MKKLTVEDLMISDVIAVREDEDLASLYELMMDNHIRHVPVVDDEERVVGIASHRDLVGVVLCGKEAQPVSMLQQLLHETKVGEIMITGVEMVEPHEQLEEAGRIMLKNKIGCLPVTDNGQIIGILTESDFVRYVVQEQRKLDNSHKIFPRVSLARAI